MKILLELPENPQDNFLYTQEDVCYDNEDICAEFDSAGNLIASYIHGQGIDEPIQVTSHTTQVTSYYTMDGLGSVRELTDASQNNVETYKYDSFGNLSIYDSSGVLRFASFVGNPYTYTGREYDSETELYFYRARYYDAEVGRFITADPIGVVGGINMYVYVEGNPINWIDPYGLYLGSDQALEDAVSAVDSGYIPGGREGLHNGPGDAYRHCLWSCRMTKKYSSIVASIAGSGHEYINDTGGYDPKESPMDIYNNKIGRELGRRKSECKDKDDCPESCRDALLSGRLKYALPNKQSPLYNPYKNMQ